MRFMTGLATIACVLGVGGAAALHGGQGADSAVQRAAAAGAQEPAQGKALFEGKGNCATCHGRDAKGTPLGPDLTDGVWLNINGSLQSVDSIIRSGVSRPTRHPAPMPPMGGARLRDAEIEAIARYVLGLQRSPS